MKNLNVLLFVAAGALVASCGSKTEETEVAAEPVVATYTLDQSASRLEWTGRKNEGDDKHVGTINVTSGSVETEDGVLKSGSFTVDMTSIATTDEMPVEVQEKLNGHLKNPDFFDTEKYPTAEVTTGELKDGKLPTTIKLMGLEFKQDVPVSVKVEDAKVTIAGTFDFDFNGLKSMGFMKDPATGVQILPTFSYNMNLVLTK